MSIQFFFQKILGIFIILIIHDLFCDIKKLSNHHTENLIIFYVKNYIYENKGKFVIRCCNCIILSLIPTPYSI